MQIAKCKVKNGRMRFIRKVRHMTAAGMRTLHYPPARAPELQQRFRLVETAGGLWWGERYYAFPGIWEPIGLSSRVVYGRTRMGWPRHRTRAAAELDVAREYRAELRVHSANGVPGRPFVGIPKGSSL